MRSWKKKIIVKAQDGTNSSWFKSTEGKQAIVSAASSLLSTITNYAAQQKQLNLQKNLINELFNTNRKKLGISAQSLAGNAAARWFERLQAAFNSGLSNEQPSLIAAQSLAWLNAGNLYQSLLQDLQDDLDLLLMKLQQQQSSIMGTAANNIGLIGMNLLSSYYGTKS